MCGIAGIVAPAEASHDALRVMLGQLRHRGPDDEGTCSLPGLDLGMRRLSILDPTPAGHQPMASPDGRCWIVYNGEIYNFLELRHELQQLGFDFRTETDTEVIHAAYQAWGAAFVQRLNGIWAFALWDGAARRLLLSRDRFGVKPLFLAERGGRLAFASEIKALLALPWVGRESDVSVVRDFLVDSLVDHTDRTFFADIRRLPAAHTLVVGPDGTRRLDRYWGPPPLSDDAGPRPDPGDAARIDEVRALLVDSVALQLRSDVPLGSCLSGGLDSSSIVAVAAALRTGRLGLAADHLRAREQSPQYAFFAEFREAGIDERRFVDAVVSATGIRLRTTTPTASDLAATLDAIVRAQDEPFLSASIVAQYHVMRIAHDAGVRVLLDGQGADEAFAGYPHYLPMAIAGQLRAPDARALRAGLRTAAAARSQLPATLGHVVLGGRPVPRRLRRDRIPSGWLGPRTAAAEALVDREPLQTGTPLSRGLWRQLSSEHLPALLRYEDRNSMAFSLEARVPFLDHRLVEAALLLPDRLRIRGDERKVALRAAVRDLVPRDVLARRDKVAFQAPDARWLRSLAAAGALSLDTAIEAGLVSHAAAGEAIGLLERGRSGPLWRLTSLERWLRSFGPSDD